MDPIVIATGNPHKVDELRAIFAEQDIPVIGLSDLPDFESLHEPDEPGSTFEENASIKALSYAGQTGRLCLADDSGLEVDALNGAPGVISSHYSTSGRDTGLARADRDAANNARLLRELAQIPLNRRSARFVCVMCLAAPLQSRGAGFQPAQGSPCFDGRMQKSYGDLPHRQVGGATYFVTFRLRAGTLSDAERRVVCDACLFWHGKRIVLHLATVMPDHVHVVFRPLQTPARSWPKLSWFMQSIKAHTARTIQASRRASGPLWQTEYFDTIIRSPEHLDEVKSYVALNPVRAGLADKPGHYPFTIRGEGGLEARPPAQRCSVIATSRGTFEGRIGLPPDVPRGANGFGYDPLFLLPPPDHRTSAELSPQEKNARSHRGAAARAMAADIKRLFPA